MSGTDCIARSHNTTHHCLTHSFRVDIYFYVEDDSMHVSEPRTANSGLPQGTLIRRHRIPLPTSTKNQHYTIADLNVGNTITIYARQFVIVGCDEFTRVCDGGNGA